MIKWILVKRPFTRCVIVSGQSWEGVIDDDQINPSGVGRPTNPLDDTDDKSDSESGTKDEELCYIDLDNCSMVGV